MRHILESFEEGTLPDAPLFWKERLSEPFLKEQLAASIKENSAQGRLFYEVSEHLTALITSPHSIHQLLFETGPVSS